MTVYPSVSWSDISIHAPREGGDAYRLLCIGDRSISIHAPREGGDGNGGMTCFVKGISIHAPREGGDCMEHI